MLLNQITKPGTGVPNKFVVKMSARKVPNGKTYIANVNRIVIECFIQNHRFQGDRGTQLGIILLNQSTTVFQVSKGLVFVSEATTPTPGPYVNAT